MWNVGLFIELLYVLSMLFISLFIQLVVHELGHVICGWVTGYKIIFMQIYYLLIYRKNNHIAIRRIDTYSSAGQCLMYPAQSIGQNDTLYNMGGCLFNSLSFCIGAILLHICDRYVIQVMGYMLTLTGFVFAVYNFMENKQGLSDGKYLREKRRYPQLSFINNKQLLIAKFLFEGKSYKEINIKLFAFDDYIDNDISAYQKILQYYYYLDINELFMAKTALETVCRYQNISEDIREEIDREMKYFFLMFQGDSDGKNNEQADEHKKSETLWSQKDKNSMDIHSIRVSAVMSTKENRQFYIDKMRNMKCIYLGEKVFCLDQINHQSVC